MGHLRVIMKKKNERVLLCVSLLCSPVGGCKRTFNEYLNNFDYFFPIFRSLSFHPIVINVEKPSLCGKKKAVSDLYRCHLLLAEWL
jgi:hypothetical protein